MTETAHTLDATSTQVRLAAERNLLSWIRTGLSMMGFGFVVAKFGLFLRELAAVAKGSAQAHAYSSSWLGVTLVAVGIVVCLAAAYQHYVFLRGLSRGAPYPAPGWSMAITVALVMAVLGSGIAMYLVQVAF